MSRAFASHCSAIRLLVPENDLPLFLSELRVEHRQQPMLRLLAAQAAQVMQRLPLHVEQLGQFFVAAVGVVQSLGQPALRALDDPLLLAQVVGLLFNRLLPLVQQPLALAQLVADLAELFFRLGLLLQRTLLDFQFRFAAPIGRLAVRALQDRAGFGLRVLSAQPVQQLHDGEGQRGSDHGTDYDRDRHLVIRRYDRTYHIPLPYRDQRGNRSAIVKRMSPCGVAITGTPHQ